MEQADGGLVDDPGDGGDLVRAGFEADGQAGQGQLGVVVGAEDDVVEQPVVGVGELRGPGGVFPRPFGEPAGEFGGFFLRGEGVVEVQDRRVVADLVADLDAALFQDGLGELGCGVAGGAPGRGGQDRVPVAADGPDLPAGMLDPYGVVVEDLAQEVPDVGGVDPGGPEAGFDLGRASGRPGLPCECGDVDRVAGIIGGGAFGGFQLVADVAGEVFGGGHQPAGSGVVEDEGAKVTASLVLIGAEQPGDLGQPDLVRRCPGRWPARRRGCRRPAGGRGGRRPGW